MFLFLKHSLLHVCACVYSCLVCQLLVFRYTCPTTGHEIQESCPAADVVTWVIRTRQLREEVCMHHPSYVSFTLEIVHLPYLPLFHPFICTFPATLLRMVTLTPIIPCICSFVKLQSLKLSMQLTNWHGSVALNRLPWRRLLIAVIRLFMHCLPQSLSSFLHSFFPSFPPFILHTFHPSFYPSHLFLPFLPSYYFLPSYLYS
jgi:hypothetical protein